MNCSLNTWCLLPKNNFMNIVKIYLKIEIWIVSNIIQIFPGIKFKTMKKSCNPLIDFGKIEWQLVIPKLRLEYSELWWGTGGSFQVRNWVEQPMPTPGMDWCSDWFSSCRLPLLSELYLQHCGIRIHVLRWGPHQGKVSVNSIHGVRFPSVQRKWVSG